MKANFEKIDHERFQQLFYTVCDITRTIARIAKEQPIRTTCAGLEFFNSIIIMTLLALSTEALPIEGKVL